MGNVFFFMCMLCANCESKYVHYFSNLPSEQRDYVGKNRFQVSIKTQGTTNLCKLSAIITKTLPHLIKSLTAHQNMQEVTVIQGTVEENSN